MRVRSDVETLYKLQNTPQVGSPRGILNTYESGVTQLGFKIVKPP